MSEALASPKHLLQRRCQFLLFVITMTNREGEHIPLLCKEGNTPCRKSFRILARELRHLFTRFP